MLAPPLAATVSSVMALGFTARETIPIVFCGFAICSVVITLTGKMGATYAVPFPVIIRSIFGMYGSFPAICIRGMFVPYTWEINFTHSKSAFVALMWTAILTVQAGNFLQRCFEAIWPSFINFPNHLSENAGIDCETQSPLIDTCTLLTASKLLDFFVCSYTGSCRLHLHSCQYRSYASSSGSRVLLFRQPSSLCSFGLSS